MGFEKVIEELLNMKSNLNAEKEERISKAIQSIENEFIDMSMRIENALKECGYVEPQPEIEEPLEEQVDNVIYDNETI